MDSTPSTHVCQCISQSQQSQMFGGLNARLIYPPLCRLADLRRQQASGFPNLKAVQQASMALLKQALSRHFNKGMLIVNRCLLGSEGKPIAPTNNMLIAVWRMAGMLTEPIQSGSWHRTTRSP